MVIVDRDGVITITVRGTIIEATKDDLSHEQLATRIAEALGMRVWVLDRSGGVPRQ